MGVAHARARARDACAGARARGPRAAP